MQDSIASFGEQGGQSLASLRHSCTPECQGLGDHALQVAAYSVIASPALHKVSQPGITALDLQPGADHVVATAGADAKVEVYDLQQQRTLADLAGHSKKVTALQFATADVLLTASGKRMRLCG
jgi:WD40 repeat protein